MTVEVERSGIRFELRRLEGVSFSDALREYKSSSDVTLNIADPQTIETFFDDVAVVGIDHDSCNHAVVIGKDGQDRVLIRDYKDLLRVSGGELHIEERTNNLSRLFVIQRVGEVETHFLIDGDNVINVELPTGSQVIKKEVAAELDRFLFVSESKAGFKHIWGYVLQDGKLHRVVAQQIFEDGDFAQFDYTKAVIQWQTSDDLSRSFIVIFDYEAGIGVLNNKDL